MNHNWGHIAKNTYTSCSKNIREYVLNDALAKVQLNRAIRKNMSFTESNNEWSELPKNIQLILVEFVKYTYNSEKFLHWKKTTATKNEECQ